MRPTEELRKGRVPARRSLLLKYNSIPPQLNIWRALKAHHFFLATLSFIALLANILTVAFSGLFSQNAIFRGQDVSLKSRLLPRVVPELQYRQGQSIGNNTFQDISADAYLVAMSNFSGGATLQSWVSPRYYFLPLETEQSGNSSSKRYSLEMTGYGAELECLDLKTSDSATMIDFGFNSTATSVRIETSHEQEDGSTIRCIPFYNSDGANIRLHGLPEGRRGLEFSGSMMKEGNNAFSASNFCSNLIFKAWVRASLRMKPDGSQQNSSSMTLSDVTIDDVQSTFIACQPRLKSAKFNLTVSSAGTILSATQTQNPIYDDPATNLSYILRETTDLISGGMQFITWHNTTTANDFPSQMISALTKSTSFLDPTLPPPDFATASTVLNDLFGRIFAIQMSLRSRLLLPAPPDAAPIPAQLQVFETRIFMSEIMFKIAMGILCVDLLVAIIFYVRAPPAFLPRLPTTIASQLAFFAASHVLEDVREAGGDLADLDRKGYRYGYGKYVGTDGMTHVGVDRFPFVTSLGVEPRRVSGLKLRERWRLWDRRGRERVPSRDRADERLDVRAI